jgi:hypothetical protein
MAHECCVCVCVCVCVCMCVAVSRQVFLVHGPLQPALVAFSFLLAALVPLVLYALEGDRCAAPQTHYQPQGLLGLTLCFVEQATRSRGLAFRCIRSVALPLPQVVQ